MEEIFASLYVTMFRTNQSLSCTSCSIVINHQAASSHGANWTNIVEVKKSGAQDHITPIKTFYASLNRRYEIRNYHT